MTISEMVISLEGIELFAYHGVHPHEREEGNTFIVDVSLEYPAEEAAKTDDLSATLDYAVVYEIVKAEMGIPSKLLEAVAKRISDKITGKYPEAKSLAVSVSKLNPPVGGTCSRARVIYKTA